MTFRWVVAVTDRAGDIVLTNAAAERIWGGTIMPGRERWERSKGWWHDSGQEIAPDIWAWVRALSHGESSLNELIDIVSHRRRGEDHREFGRAGSQCPGADRRGP